MNQKLVQFLKENPDKIDEVLEETPEFLTNSRPYVSKSKEARIAAYKKNKALRAQILENRIPFISPNFDPDFFLCQGMTIVGAKSGESKSTTCANVIAGFIKHSPGKKVIVITNEEGPDAVIDRVSCILHKKNYIELYKGRISNRDRDLIETTSINLTDTIEIVDDSTWDMACLEDVIAVLESAAKNKLHMVVLDYLQTVTYSRDEPQLESYQVSKRLGLFLKDYGRRVGVPVIVFAQLKPKTDGGAIQDRVQNDKTIYNHAFNVIEVIPNFDTLVTEFIIHKGRFELKQGKKIVMKFVGGRYEMDSGEDL